MLKKFRRIFWLFRMKRKHSLLDLKRYLFPIKQSTFNNWYLHMLVVNKIEYIDAGIRCAGSFLNHNPGSKVKFYVDSRNQTYLTEKLKRWRLTGLSEVELLTTEQPWQLHKLEIILNTMTSSDLFSDADLYWNGSLESSRAPYCFVREYAMSENATYSQLLDILGLDSRNYAMLNTSVVALGSYAQNEELKNVAFGSYQRIIEICDDSAIAIGQRNKIKRLAEQLSLSIAMANIEKDKLGYLKETDSPMDGGVAESYYLGTTRGWG